MFQTAGNPHTNIFANKVEGGDEDSEGAYKDDDEGPTVVLGEDVNTKNPFSKNYEKQVDKFKIAAPENLKKNLGQGKVSIQIGQLGTEEKQFKVFKLVFKNHIGKTLYEGDISGKFSKHRVVQEKATKNQIKVLVIQFNKESKKPETRHVLINFQRESDMKEFETAFKKSIEEAKSAIAGK